MSTGAVPGLSSLPSLAAAQFEFTCDPFEASELLVARFDCSEELSRPYEARLELVSREPIDPRDLLGKEALVQVRLLDDTARPIHGIVCAVNEHYAGSVEGHRYRVTVVPRVWQLRHVRRSRIFQGLTALEIVLKVLNEHDVDVEVQITGDYQPRDYCVQYRESDLQFIGRLLEEEGVFYFFQHDTDKHVMVLVDANDLCDVIDGDPDLPFRGPSGMTTHGEFLDRVSATRAVRPSAVVLRDFDYLHPSVDLTASVADTTVSPSLEVYEHHARYADPTGGTKRARVRLQQERWPAEVLTASGSCRRLAAGRTFYLSEHPSPDTNAEYLLVGVRHSGYQPELVAGEAEGASEARDHFRSEITCVPNRVPFRQLPSASRPIVPGPQTAIVVGPAGEEIFTDELGRVKVQFHWDREGKSDDHSSCWVRVSQSWAGPGWGGLFLPRIGHEVVVEFIEGDPDRPLVTGSVYNGQNVTPQTLPDEATASTVRSASTPGGNGANQLRIEDSAGAEQIYLHAQKDLKIAIENDKSQIIGGNESLQVKVDRSREIQGNQSLLVAKDDTTAVHGNQSLDVGQNRSTTIGGSHTEVVGANQSISVGVDQSIAVGGAASETVAVAKSISVGATMSVTVGAALNIAVGAASAEEIAGDKTETIGGDKSETVGGNRQIDVGADSQETVGGAYSLKVAKDAVVEVGANYNVTVKEAFTAKAKEIIFGADEQITIQVGDASILLKKNGDVIIKGGKIEVTSSGDVVIKGSNIGEN